MMEAAKDDSSGAERQHEWPLTSELIETLIGAERFNAAHARKIKEITQHYTGCVVLVFHDGKLIPRKGMYKVQQINIGPTAEAG